MTSASNRSRDQLEAAARAMIGRERDAFVAARPRCAARGADGRGKAGFLDGAPMHWMLDWPTPFPLVIDAAHGVEIVDLDGNALTDLCLGDTGAMFGHGPAPIIKALEGAARRGLTTMLPSSDAEAVGRLLAERFGLPFWQIAATASDANRFAIRVARAVTGRDRILVFDGCYHGAVDDTLVDLEDGRTIWRKSLLGQPSNARLNTVSIPFNDEAALKAALAGGDIACVLAEPVMTNCGMILPQAGFLEHLRQATGEAGTRLLIDETHTLSSGLGGYARGHGLAPDLFVAGKAVAGGVPTALWGMSAEIADRLARVQAARPPGHSGIGTTLSGSALQLACLRASLESVMTPEAYQAMETNAERIASGLARAVRSHDLPWHVVRVGARIEVVFSDRPVRNAQEARAAASHDLEAALHLGLLNRGFLVTPFHNMVLVAPGLGPDRADAFVRAYEDVLGALMGLA